MGRLAHETARASRLQLLLEERGTQLKQAECGGQDLEQ